ncbi:hypothetical protein [Billgrantia kenyensis]|jgi:hypothetical protein|uniref:Uncharacterized protein n=1 Tax=Billgrantia kenyensis TaxID=321266 RepID=A0A7W0AFC0_9GAMM|nr:hypothetical protein [Halomonas kenyensis]MBA2781236.1 hypothetical protein [Halomonas kenyensis]MCG6662938.1 hypothetical protein [Halomonas kenyensis]
MTSLERVLGGADAAYTPADDTDRVEVPLHICDKQVPPAAQSILGRCEFYYRPLHGEYIEKSGVSTWEALKAWASRWNPVDDVIVFRRLLSKREQLIMPESDDDDWSRHANFMMRHIGCGHQPPDYYVSYGYYYCSTYGERLRPRLSVQGKDWLDKARKALQENIEDGLDDNMSGDQIEVHSLRYPNRSVAMEVAQYELEVDNATFKTFAFNTHVPAYLDAGLADLRLDDLAKIGGQPDVEEWLDGETWRQAVDSGVEVYGEKGIRGIALEGVEIVGEVAVDTYNNVADSVRSAGDAVENALRSLIRRRR